mgnify:CR=1 FL=1
MFTIELTTKEAQLMLEKYFSDKMGETEYAIYAKVHDNLANYEFQQFKLAKE